MESKKFVNCLLSGINSDNNLFVFGNNYFYMISTCFYFPGKQTIKMIQNWTRKREEIQWQLSVRYKITSPMFNFLYILYISCVCVCVYIYIYICDICIFIGCWPYSIKGRTHRTHRTCVFLTFLFKFSNDVNYHFYFYSI